jgi:hypothetical protein
MSDKIDDEPEFVVSHFLSRPRMIFAIFCLLFVSISWYYYEYHYTLNSEVPLLEGDLGPTRIRPESNEATLTPNADKMLYDNFMGKNAKDHISSVTVVPEPEQPLKIYSDNTNMYEDVISQIIDGHEAANVQNNQDNSDEFTKYLEQNINDNNINKTLNIVSIDQSIEQNYSTLKEENSILYYVQILSSRSIQEGEREWQNLLKSHYKTLHNFQHFIEKTEIHGRGIFYRLLVGEFTKFSQAKAVCKKLMDSNKPCVVIKGK